VIDKFEELFQLQHDLQIEAFGRNFQRMLQSERVIYIREMQQAAIMELCEALDEVGWKTWATSRHINRDAYIGELVDVLHFWINMLLALGDDPTELAREVFTRYGVKGRINAERQARGYDGVSSKCPACNRDVADMGVMCSITLRDNNGKPTHGRCEKHGTYQPASMVALKKLSDTV
jgi:hypothetical protein